MLSLLLLSFLTLSTQFLEEELLLLLSPVLWTQSHRLDNFHDMIQGIYDCNAGVIARGRPASSLLVWPAVAVCSNIISMPRQSTKNNTGHTSALQSHRQPVIVIADAIMDSDNSDGERVSWVELSW